MNSTASRRLQIVVLAAGFSTRLGHPKALARIQGVSLLRRTLQLAASFKGPVYVIVPPHSARLKSEARGIKAVFKVNSRRSQGLSSSVRRAVLCARYSAALLLLPVDLAHLRRRDIARLISRWRASPRRVIARRVATPASPALTTARLRTQGGTPLILPRWLHARSLNISGDMGLRGMLMELAEASRVFIDLPSAALDIDTPQDLNSARRRCAVCHAHS
jgi:molybdenum cofactor cytidylyltransferase